MLLHHHDEQFFNVLYDTHYDAVFKLISNRLYAYTGSTRDAADLTQEVFIEAAKKIKTLREHSNPKSWLFKAAVNKCCNYARTYARHKELLFNTLDPQKAADDDIAAVDTLMYLKSKLSKEDYELLCAYCLEENSKEDVCRRFGIKSRTLDNRICKIRKFLSNLFIFLVTIAICQYI